MKTKKTAIIAIISIMVIAAAIAIACICSGPSTPKCPDRLDCHVNYTMGEDLPYGVYVFEYVPNAEYSWKTATIIACTVNCEEIIDDIFGNAEYVVGYKTLSPGSILKIDITEESGVKDIMVGDMHAGGYVKIVSFQEYTKTTKATKYTTTTKTNSYPDRIYANSTYDVGSDLPYGVYIVRIKNANSSSTYYVRAWRDFCDPIYDSEGRIDMNAVASNTAACILNQRVNNEDEIRINLRESSGAVQFEFQTYGINDSAYLEVVSFEG